MMQVLLIRPYDGRTQARQHRPGRQQDLSQRIQAQRPELRAPREAGTTIEGRSFKTHGTG